MKAPIQIRSSLVAGNVPVSLLVGEIGINEADGLLFYRGPTGVVTSFNLAGGGGGGAPINSPVFTGDPRAPTPSALDNDTSIATTAFVTTAITGKADTTTVTASLALKADLASPTFTGDPKAPTPSTGDNDTSIATTAFVKAQSYLTSADLSTYAPLASPVLTGNPTAPTPAAGDADTSIATTAFVATYFEKLHGIGQCYLSLSGANLLLAPRDGNLILINGALVTIPDAGVTLAPTSTAATTFYYIYAYMSGVTLTLEYSTTAYATQAGTGVRIKSGDSTRTLVGIWSSAAAGAWSTGILDGMSWFNPKRKFSTNGGAGPMTPSTTSTALVEMASAYRQPFVCFAGALVRMFLSGSVAVGGVNMQYFWNIVADGGATLMPGNMRVLMSPGSGGTIWTMAHCEALVSNLAEGRHYASGYHYVVGATTGNGDNVVMAVEIWG